MTLSFVVMKVKEWRMKEPRATFAFSEILFMSIPALLSAVANLLFYYLHRTLENELVIQAFGSMEIVVIGIASVVLLGRTLSGIQWSAIVLLCTSVMSIEIGTCSSCSLTDLPLFPSLVAIGCSGLEGIAGVFNEKILKERSDVSTFQQNVWITLYDCGLACQ